MLKVNDYNTNKYNSPSFTARKVAVVKSIFPPECSKAPIEIYSIGKKDKPFLDKLVKSIDMRKLMPSKLNEPNFSIWQELIEFISGFIGTTSHQRAFLALHNKKPCGLLVSVCNRTSSEIIGLATWPTAVENKIRNAGRSLVTALLDVASSKNHKKLKLEPILQGPTDAVGFYKKMGLTFPDPNASVMTVSGSGIVKNFNKQAQELNYQKIKNSPEINLDIVTT